MKIDRPIIQKIEFYNIDVILLDENPIHNKEIFNIIGINKNSDIVWKIESPLSKYGIKNMIPYTLIVKISDKEFIATNFYGVSYKISAEDGKILTKEEVSK